TDRQTGPIPIRTVGAARRSAGGLQLSDRWPNRSVPDEGGWHRSDGAGDRHGQGKDDAVSERDYAGRQGGDLPRGLERNKERLVRRSAHRQQSDVPEAARDG